MNFFPPPSPPPLSSFSSLLSFLPPSDDDDDDRWLLNVVIWRATTDNSTIYPPTVLEMSLQVCVCRDEKRCAPKHFERLEPSSRNCIWLGMRLSRLCLQKNTHFLSLYSAFKEPPGLGAGSSLPFVISPPPSPSPPSFTSTPTPISGSCKKMSLTELIFVSTVEWIVGPPKLLECDRPFFWGDN